MLSIEDIEQAFDAALQQEEDQAFNFETPQQHPLKRDSRQQRFSPRIEHKMVPLKEPVTSIRKKHHHHHHHRRANSSESGRHRFGKPNTDPMRHRKKPPVVARPKSFSAQHVRSSSWTAAAASPHHRRVTSWGAASSVATDASFVSHVSDIRQSALFTGYSRDGTAQLQFPMSFVHLVPDSSYQDGVGKVYQVPLDPDIYEDYHAEEEALPPLHYVLTVPSDCYRRVVDEMVLSKLPCGCFFCGHHSDVSRPSVWIAVTTIASLLLGMAYLAYMVKS
jgi:hypothetical protein